MKCETPYFDELILRFPELNKCYDNIIRMYNALVICFESGRKLLICGNGGSAADALHMTGELMKSFVRKRSLDEGFVKRFNDNFDIGTDDILSGLQGALPVYPLVENASLTTAYSNDVDPDFSFAQQVYGYAREGDAVLGISTSGNAANVNRALMVAKGRGATTLGLSGMDGGRIRNLCDVCICVPETETYKVQELHLPVYHSICLALENHFWGGQS